MKYIKLINELNTTKLKTFFITEDNYTIILWRFIENSANKKYVIVKLKQVYDKENDVLNKIETFTREEYLNIDAVNVLYNSDSIEDASNMLLDIIEARKYNL